MSERAYMPASGTEGADFFTKWCCNCRRDENGDNGDGCSILANSYAGIQADEWQYWRGEPICTAFDGDDFPYLRGNAVADLFPRSRRRPTQGEQIRLLVKSSLTAKDEEHG